MARAATPKPKADDNPLTREVAVVPDSSPMLDVAQFELMQRVAASLAKSSFIPKHLKTGDYEETFANVLLVVNQAQRWNMDPHQLAQHTFVVGGKLGYEGKVVAAIVNAQPRLTGKLNYTYSGEGDKRAVVVSGRLRGESKDREVDGTVEKWKTNNENWHKSRDQMLSYRGAREWARRHMPETILGIYSEDDLEMMATDPATAAAAQTYSEEWTLVDGEGEVVTYFEPADYAKAFVAVAATIPAELYNEWRQTNDTDTALSRLHKAGLSDLIVMINEAQPAEPTEVLEAEPVEETPEAPPAEEAAEPAPEAEEGGPEPDPDAAPPADEMFGESETTAEVMVEIPVMPIIEQDAPRDEWSAWFQQFRASIVELDLMQIDAFLTANKQEMEWMSKRGPGAYETCMKDITTRREALQQEAAE